MTLGSLAKPSERSHRVPLFLALLTLALGGGGLALWGPSLADNGLGLSDKNIHVLAFGTVSLLAALFKPRAVWFVAPVGMIYGGAIELAQPYFGRSADWMDVRANAVGVGLGLAAGLFLRLVWSRLAATFPVGTSPKNAESLPSSESAYVEAVHAPSTGLSLEESDGRLPARIRIKQNQS